MSELRIGKPVPIAGMTLIPIEKIEIRTLKARGGYASKEPFAIIISCDNHYHALDSQGDELPINDLMAQLPQLSDVLKNVNLVQIQN